MLTKQHFILVMLPDARRQRVPLPIPEGARNRAGDVKEKQILYNRKLCPPPLMAVHAIEWHGFHISIQ